MKIWNFEFQQAIYVHLLELPDPEKRSRDYAFSIWHKWARWTDGSIASKNRFMFSLVVRFFEYVIRTAYETKFRCLKAAIVSPAHKIIRHSKGTDIQAPRTILLAPYSQVTLQKCTEKRKSTKRVCATRVRKNNKQVHHSAAIRRVHRRTNICAPVRASQPHK